MLPSKWSVSQCAKLRYQWSKFCDAHRQTSKVVISGIEYGVAKCQREAMAGIYEHLESHRNDQTTIDDLELVLQKYDLGLVRNIATALYHMSIVSMRGRVHRLVLKAAKPEGLSSRETGGLAFEMFDVVTSWTQCSDRFGATCHIL